MDSLLTPKLDYVFKKLFTKDTALLINLINSVLELPEHHRILSVEIKNPAILQEEIADKYIVLDIRVTDHSENQYDIEMQAQNYEGYPKRALYYLSKIYVGQLKAGEEYGILKPVIGIHFLSYKLFPEYDDFHFRFDFRESRHPELKLTDDMSLYVFELPKIKQVSKGDQPMGDMVEWLHFFSHAHKEVKKTMRTHYKNPAIHDAFNFLEEMSADEKTRYLAEIREKSLKNKNSELGAARREGRREREKGIAMNMVAMSSFSIEQISQATGLSMDEVGRLQNTRQAEAA